MDIENQIVTVNGGVEGLYCSILGLVNPGDEVLQFDPSYDCYRPQIQMAGGKCIGLPLKPVHQQSKQELKERCKDRFRAGKEDEWEIDFEAFEKALNEKTKMLILNTPHNPTGKVFTEEEMARLAKILQKFPQVVVVEDNVYEGMTFDDMLDVTLPKMAFQENMFDRCLSIYSAGKIFAATGVRSGWVIGPANLIKSVRSVHQYTVFCPYNVTENAIRQSLDVISRPEDTYMHDYASKLEKNRDILLDILIKSKYDFNLWIPKGGYFIMADISKCEIQEKYLKDEEGNERTRDYAFSVQLAYEDGVVAIPCSPFYSLEEKKIGEKYVRFAFCKDEELIVEAGKRMAPK